MKWILLTLSIAALWHYGQSNMEARCLPGWEEPHGSGECYTQPEKNWKKNYNQAREFCKGHGGDSLIIKDQKTKDWVNSTMQDLGITGVVYTNAKLINNTWTWQEDQTEVNLTLLPLDPGDGNCGTFTTTGRLKGVKCSDNHVFMCHRSIDNPPLCDHESGWEQMSDHCYLKSSEQKIWNDSLSDCTSYGGSLITINDDVEQRFAKDIAHHSTGYVWIGISEVGHPEEYLWADGDTSNYTRWQQDQPSKEFEGRGAGAIDREQNQGLWMSLDGESNLEDYLCEKEQGACVYGWETFGESCYYFNTEKTDVLVWGNAKDTCEEVGAHLVIIDNEEENDFIKVHMDIDDSLWIGLSSTPHDNIYWVNGNPMNFTHMTDEDKERAIAAADPSCVIFHVEGDPSTGESRWTPTDCHSPKHYICEIKQGDPVHLIHHPSDKYCPDGWLMKDDRCYFFSQEEKIWPDAQSFCQNNNDAGLISIDSWAEQDFVHCNIQTNILLGFTDTAEEGKWIWCDGSLDMDLNWSDGEPNGGTNQNCGVMFLADGKWDDWFCDRTRNYGCERAAKDAPFGPVVSTTPKPPPYSENCGGVGWVENPNTGECYYVNLNEESAYDSSIDCTYLDWPSSVTLLSLSTSEEYEFVIGWLQEQHYSQQSFFIGLGNDVDMGTYWSDDTPVGFLNWADGEPTATYEESCVVMFTNDGTWNDVFCSENHASICEKKGPNYVPLEPPPPPQPKCPDGWTYFNTHCYYIYDTKVSWNTADAWCQSHLNSTLASIINEDENIFLNGLAEAKGMDLWIGLHDDGAGTNWYWEDGSNLDQYKNWNDTQPDDYAGNEHCGQLRPALGGHWNDLSCATENGFVCKIILDVCPVGWKYHEKKCYFGSDIPKPNDEARKACMEFNANADLVTINSDEENEYFKDVLPHGPLSVWIGYTYDESAQTWNWDDGSTSNYTHWNDNEPNFMETERCTEIIDAPDQSYYGKWNNLACSEARNFGCEYFPRHYLGCEEGWFLFDEACYYISPDAYSSYDNAIRECVNLGGQLASIHSQEENDFIFSNFEEYGYNSYWIGMSDTGHPEIMTWVDGSTVTYTFWERMSLWIEADCLCVSMDKITSKWIAYPCFMENNFVCKKAPQPKEIEPVDSGCHDDGDMYFKGSCYNVPNQMLSWNDSKKLCEDSGAYLVRIEEEHEGAFFAANLGDFGSDIWTDGKVHKYEDESIDFIFDNGKLVTYLPWDANQPDLTIGNCILATGTLGDSGLYRISQCEAQLNFICEYDRVGYTTPAPEPTPTHGTFCYDGWDHSEGHCYLTYADPHTWAESEAICQSYGGHLASINSENEESEISYVISQAYLSQSFSSVWVGLELDTLADKHWTDGSSIDFLDWDTDQPKMHDHENCASVDSYYTKLSCTVCESHLPFVCEALEGSMISTLAPPTIQPPTKCEDGEGDWYLYKDHCYKFVSEAEEDPQSWEKSAELCKAEGSYLTSVLDIDENYFIEAMISKLSDDGMWLGGRATDDSGWSWVDGSPYTYDSWAKGEPNHFLDQEDCVEMLNLRMGKWNDKNCGHLNGRVCKRPYGATYPPVVPTISPPGNCPKDWVTVSTTGRCFKFVDTETYFDDAVQSCKGLYSGANLVSIHTPKEMAYITAGVGLLGKDAWIGLRYEMDEYVWVDQSTVSYTPWAPGEPNGQYYGEDCVEAIYPTGQMNDISSYNYYGYICAMERDPSITEPSTFPKCDPPYHNYFQYRDDCYRADNTGKSWQDAEKTCVEEGTHLSSADNINENAFMWILGQNEDTYHPWIGLNNLRDKDTYEWSDNWPVVSTFWGKDQPQVNSTDKNCVRINSDDGLWYNEKCDELKSFLCKHSKDEAPTPGPPVVGHCPDGPWVDLKGNFCYMYIDEIRTWNDANGNCLLLDSNLTSIHSEAENSLMEHVVKNKESNVWLGLIQKKSGLGWSDGTAYDYSNWHTGEPSGDDEPCTEFYAEDGTWNDVHCEIKRQFICKAAKIPEKEPTNPTSSPYDTTPDRGGGGSGGLSGGAIFGIVFAVLVVFATVGFLGVSYIKKKKVNNDYSFSSSASTTKLDLNTFGGEGTDA